MEFSKLSSLIVTGSVLHTIDGMAYRVSSRTTTPTGFSFKLANLQGQPVPTPKNFQPVPFVFAHLARELRHVLAYNSDFDMYVKEYIRAAGLPVDNSYNWDKWFQDLSRLLQGDDQDVKDEAIHNCIIRNLGERNILVNNFPEAIKKFPPAVKEKPLAEQVTAYLTHYFKAYRVSEMNEYIKELLEPDNVPIDEGWEEGPDYGSGSSPGQQDVGGNRSILDTEEFATSPGQYEVESQGTIGQAREGFKRYVEKTQTKVTAKNLVLLFDVYMEMGTQHGGKAKISEVFPEWHKRTGLGFDALKTYWKVFPGLLAQYIEQNIAQLGGEGSPWARIINNLKENTETEKSRGAKASLKTAAMCTCGHPFEIHTHPPDFGCPHEPECGCKGATEVKEAIAPNVETVIQGSMEGPIELNLSLEQAQNAYHQGNCDADVEAVCNIPEVAAQLERIDPSALAHQLQQYGSWDSEELQDHDQNLRRLVWLIAGDLVEEMKNPEEPLVKDLGDIEFDKPDKDWLKAMKVQGSLGSPIDKIKQYLTFEPTVGAIEIIWKGKTIGYLGLPILKMWPALECWLEASQEQNDDLTWKVITDRYQTTASRELEIRQGGLEVIAKVFE